MRSAPHPTIAQLLDERADALVGRDRELAALLRLVGPDGPQVAYVHGVAGAGKSALLRSFAARARARGAATVQLDGAEVEPTARGLRDALAAALPEAPTGDRDAVGRLAARGECVVLSIDAVERLRLLEDWLRRTFIPSLPQHVRVVLAGRERPDPTWAATYADLLIDLPLGNLPAAAVATLLPRLGVAPCDVSRVNRVARGHPLSLQLAASALAARPDLPLEQVATTAVVDQLAGLYVEGLDRPTRQALDAAALVRRPTRSLLRALLPDADADAAFARLEALPFTHLGSDGLVLHDAVREALDAALRAGDPERRRRLRTAAYRHLRSELRSAQAGDVWRATADMLHLIDNPLIRDGFFPPAEQRYAVEPAGERDRAAIAGIAERHEPDAGAELLAAWFGAAPECFRV
ncbi:MAG TPA: ATP-binding protein, partial [Solirubrobacteraceae bacterium]|nr:ATP-binding protein [Solirubrobacteraceae bacterium]